MALRETELLLDPENHFGDQNAKYVNAHGHQMSIGAAGVRGLGMVMVSICGFFSLISAVSYTGFTPAAIHNTVGFNAPHSAPQSEEVGCEEVGFRYVCQEHPHSLGHEANITDWKDCAHECHKDPHCHHWVWSKNTNNFYRSICIGCNEGGYSKKLSIPDPDAVTGNVNCRPGHCAPHEFACEGEGKGVCLYKHFLCNGREDCPGGSDERNCHHLQY